MLDDVTAVILAGGIGSRLRSLVSDRQKVLADVNGRPFITHLFDQILPRASAGPFCAQATKLNSFGLNWAQAIASFI